MRIAFCTHEHPGGFGGCVRPVGHDGAHRDNQPGRNTWTDADALAILVDREAFRVDSILRRIR